MKLERLLDLELLKRHYSDKTIRTYKSWVMRLCEYFPDTSPKHITIDQISEYISLLINRRKLSPQTIHQAVAAFRFFFNDILDKKDYDLDSIPRPKRERLLPDLLTQGEVFILLKSVLDLRHKLILSLIYSTGMDISEAVRLKVTDIDLKYRRINVKCARKKGSRSAIIAEAIHKDLASYIEVHKPRKWLFEGRPQSEHVSVSAIQRSFSRALGISGIDKKASVKSLRYSYIKHLEKLGYPLRNILQELGIFDTSSIEFYSKIDHVDVKITSSPLDVILRTQHQKLVDVSSLKRMLDRLTNDDEKDYLLESITCINTGAHRAGVIFAWSSAIRNLQQRSMNHSLKTVNMLVKKHSPRASDIRTIDDFSYIKDRTTLEVCRELGELDKSEKDVLVECLNLRNKCGHPGKYRPKPLKVSAFIEDLITIVFS